MTTPTARVRLGRQEGSTSLELVVVFPAVLLLIFGIVQAGLWYHARNVASYAAVEGLRAAQSHRNTAGAGVGRAREVLARAAAEGFMKDANVAGTRGARETSITVTARGITLLPLIPAMTIKQTASGPTERISEEP